MKLKASFHNITRFYCIAFFHSQARYHVIKNNMKRLMGWIEKSILRITLGSIAKFLNIKLKIYSSPKTFSYPPPKEEGYICRFGVICPSFIPSVCPSVLSHNQVTNEVSK